jgi:hypothetical protein
MDDIDCAAERIEAFNAVAINMVLAQNGGPASTGICKSCGCLIEAERLRANARARHCMDCAAEHEEEKRKRRMCGPR